MDKPEYLGPMARSLIETFAGLTLPQQRRVLEALHEIVVTNEQAALLNEAALAGAHAPARAPARRNATEE